MTWSEHDGPPVTPPEHKGFGMRKLESGVAYELGGEVVVDYATDGLVCRMCFPADRTLARDG